DGAQIGPAVDFWRCADRDEDDDRFPDGRREIRGEREAPVANIARHHLLQTRLVDGHVPRLEGGDLVSDVVNAHDLVSEIGEDGASYETDVSGTNHAYVHRTIIIAELMRGLRTLPRLSRPRPSGRTPP